MARRKTLSAALALVAVAAALASAPSSAPAKAHAGVQTIRIHYRSYAGVRRSAWVVLPADYSRTEGYELPLIISPHGRGLTGRGNAAAWGDLAAVGGFTVVNPDGQGRKLGPYSWGYAGQIEDLARMPQILERTLPWLKIDRSRIYSFGGSMGGQETLLLVARHPNLLAGAAVFDSVADFARQYRAFPRLRCNTLCHHRWKGSLGRNLQHLAREEIGGSPRTAPRAFALRSPITYARRIAQSCVPLQIWWSVSDRIVVDQQQQSARLFADIRRLNPLAPVSSYKGFWNHSYEMQSGTRLPLALMNFDLIPPDPHISSGGMLVTPAPVDSPWCGF
jgi:dipeptidyl aminopeptidase/acylaminoacyl peptidase